MHKDKILSDSLFGSIKTLQESGCVYQSYQDQTYDGRRVTINDKEMLHFASCGYLGLETNEEMIAATIDAVKRYGTQNSMSRAMISCPLYKETEELLKQIFPGEQIVFPTTTLAHCSVLPAIIQPEDAIILDAYAHNSLRMSSQLCASNGTYILKTKHNDIDFLKYMVYRLKKEGYKKIWYLADGVYSIHGNVCKVKELYNLLESESSLYAYVDDAHGLGWYGKHGRGCVLGEVDLHERMIVSGSLSKSFGACGGIVVVKDKDVADYIRYTGQTMIFSGPIQPALLGALHASAKLHLSDTIVEYQNELKDLIQFFRAESSRLELPVVTEGISPIQLLRIGDMDKTFQVLSHLMQNGFFAMTAGYPAISKGDEGIRITVTRHLSKQDISNFLQCVKDALQLVNSKDEASLEVVEN